MKRALRHRCFSSFFPSSSVGCRCPHTQTMKRWCDEKLSQQQNGLQLCSIFRRSMSSMCVPHHHPSPSPSTYQNRVCLRNIDIFLLFVGANDINCLIADHCCFYVCTSFTVFVCCSIELVAASSGCSSLSIIFAKDLCYLRIFCFYSFFVCAPSISV